MVLVVGGMLGIIVTAALVAHRLRVEVLTQVDPPTGTRRSGAGTVGLVLGLLVLVEAAVAIGPYVVGVVNAPPVPSPFGGHNVVASWVPTLLGATLQLVVAALGAIGLGWFRPVGRARLRLLLLFAPWLFVGSGPLWFVRFHPLVEDGAPRSTSWLDRPPSCRSACSWC